MTSRDALRTILINCKDLLVDENYSIVYLEDLITTIKQDLERLEQLEKENQELLINKNVAQKIATKLKNDNDKLKNAIVSKKRIQSLRETANPIYEVVIHIPQNLLKEVLDYDREK